MRRLSACCAALLLVFGAAPLPGRAAAPSYVVDRQVSELSGCARSRRDPQRLWVHNDSGNPARLFAIDLQGHLQQTVAIDAAAADDWEDIAGFNWHGVPSLAVADTGDNLARRDESAVLLLAEPASGVAHVRPQRTIRFRYPGGSRDVESIAVDAATGEILLLEKRRPPARLYRLALDGPEWQQAQWIATLPDWWPEPPTPVEPLMAQQYRGAASAMDLSDDGLRLAILTATHWMVFTRHAGEPWARALARAPRIARIPRTGVPRYTIFEALCWAADGGIWLSGERLPAPLLHLEPAQLR